MSLSTEPTTEKSASAAASGASSGGPDGPGGLLTALLAESREMTAVERFAKAHEENTHEQARYYRDLIPLTTPGEGEQYAFDVDLDACSGCKACVSACHHMNGLEPTETWRSVGQLYGSNGLPVIQHVTTACHHCVEPGCLNGCPTNAYEKDPHTGVVRHLDDQCFGCQYCTMACPYEVPQYSASKGIVRKCDMCHDRLSAGEAPACVQACPNQAIRISVVRVADVQQQATAGEFLPDSPPPTLTQPTTQYRSTRGLPANALGADYDHAEPQHAHLPLVAMLVLTQMSVGAVALGALARWLGGDAAGGAAMVLGAVVGQLGLAAATLHLGRPHLAFRAVLGWRHSWLSREAIVFGGYAGSSIAAMLYHLQPLLAEWLPAFATKALAMALPVGIRPLVEVTAIVTGAAGVYCSVRIYQFTGREFWLGWRTGLKFGGSAVVLGSASLLVVLAALGPREETSTPLAIAALLTVASTIAKLTYERRITAATDERSHALGLTAQLLAGPLGRLSKSRLALAVAGGIAGPLLVLAAGGGWQATAVAIAGLLCLTLGELAERTLYFSAVVPLKMPGELRS